MLREWRESSYLGVYDEDLMGPEYDTNRHFGEYLEDRVIIGNEEILRQTNNNRVNARQANNNRINKNLEARRPLEELWLRSSLDLIRYR